VLGLKWSELDIVTGVWTLPADRAKQREAHVVLLSPSALAVLEKMRCFGDAPGAYVFPSPKDPREQLGVNAMLAVIDRMGYGNETTAHGIARATFSTWAYENNVARSDVIECALGHREADQVKAAYSRTFFDAEREKLLLAWADFCDGKQPTAVAPAPTAQIIPMAIAA
jgi:integrase